MPNDNTTETDAPEALTPEQEIETRRAARREATAKAEQAQRLVDLQAIDALEEEFGETRLAVLRIPYTAGLPTCAVARAPSPGEVKRYRDQIRPGKDGDQPDMNPAVELLASACVKYPSRDVFEKMCEKRPGIHVQLGLFTLKLAAGEAEAQGKGSRG